VEAFGHPPRFPGKLLSAICGPNSIGILRSYGTKSSENLVQVHLVIPVLVSLVELFESSIGINVAKL
jgi:hypothetical protein